MDIPFKLELYNYMDEQIIIEKFANSQQNLLENEIKYSIEVKENHDLSLRFLSNHDSKLEIELLDVLPEHCFTEEELEDEKPVFLPSNHKRHLYLNKESPKNEESIDYPSLIPGSYKVIVKTKAMNYYAFLKIMPLRIDEDQLQIMKEEIDYYINGLSKQFRKGANIDILGDSEDSLLHKTTLFIEQKNIIINALSSIIEHPKYEIQREYKLKELSKSGRIDFKTIRYKQRRMDIHDKLLTFNHTLNYNVDENKTIKYIVNYLYKQIRICLFYLNENKKRKNSEITEAKYYRRSGVDLISTYENLQKGVSELQLLSNLFQRFLSTEWVQVVENTSFFNNPRKLVRNSQYNAVYFLYQQLINKKDIIIDPLKNYHYFWRESSKLYEIWCFLKVLEAIEQSKFDMSPVEGWIYDLQNSEVMPFLDPDTRIVFKNRRELKFVLYYDSKILDSQNCNIDNPVFTTGINNRPDFRIDIYKNELYLESIIGDFKYRRYESLGNINSFMKSRGNNKAYKQLLSYSQVRSLYVKSEESTERSEGIARETWAFYPTKISDSETNRRNFDVETNIRRLKLSPNKGTSELVENLERIIEGIIKVR